MALKTYEINYFKSNDACSIDWQNEEYSIKDLEASLISIECDDGDLYHQLTLDDFKIKSFSDFEPVLISENNYRLCFVAEVLIDLEKKELITFKKALVECNFQVVARLEFKKNGKDILDKNGDYAYLFEPDEDKFVELQLKD